MPNWCYNECTISGPDMNKFWKAATVAGGFAFSNIIPYEYPKSMYMGAGIGFHQCAWGNLMWDTKWEPEVDDVKVYHDKIVCKYNTAYSPPNKFWKTVVDKYDVNITNKYWLESEEDLDGYSTKYHSDEFHSS